MESQQHIDERGVTVESHRSFRLSRIPDAVLSSGSTSYHKRWFPALFSGFLLGPQLFIIALVGHVTPQNLVFLGISILILAVFISLHRCIVFCLDEVVDEGDFLLVRNGRHQERVPLGSIAGVLDNPSLSPFSRITLNLDQPCRFGQKITFIPRYRFGWIQWGPHPLVYELRSRVEAVRGNQPGINSKKSEPGAAAEGGGGGG